MTPFPLQAGGVEMDAARASWRCRALLVGGGLQVVFGALWILRGLAVFAPVWVALASGAAVLVAGLAWAYSLRSTGPRPTGPAARRLEHRLTIATAAQLVASVALPVLVAMVDSRLVLPSIVVTIGALLVYVHRVAGAPYQGIAGWLLVALSVAALAFAGPAQTASVCIASALILLSCAAAGFHWLRGQPPRPLRGDRAGGTRQHRGRIRVESRLLGRAAMASAILLTACVLAPVVALATPTSAALGHSGRLRVAAFGDSLMYQSFPYLSALLTHTGRTEVQGHYFGGTAPCDWIATMRAIAAADRPEAVVLEFAGNSLTPCMAGLEPGTPVYYRRYMGDMGIAVSIFLAHGASHVYVVGSPIPLDRSAATTTIELKADLESLVVFEHTPRVSWVDAGRADESASGGFTWTLPCLDVEPVCDGPVIHGVHENMVRQSDGGHFCPTGLVGSSCPVYSSGAYRFGAAMAAAVVSGAGLGPVPEA